MYSCSWWFAVLHIYVFPLTQHAWNVFVARKGSNWAVSVLGDTYKFDEFVQHHLRAHIGLGPNDVIEWGECVFCATCVVVHWEREGHCH